MTSETLIRLDTLIHGARKREKIRSYLLRKIVRCIYYLFDIILGFPKMWFIIRKMNCGDPNKRPIGLAIVAIAKNESEYIAEWVAYHKAVGVDRIYLYDNDSTDNMKDSIQKFIDDGFVIYNQIHGACQQFPAYCKGLWKYGRECKYMAFIDCDEFLTPVHYGNKIIDLLDHLFTQFPKAGGVLINWCMYGSSHFEKKPDGLLIENFVYRANIGKKGTNVTKTILRPECALMWDHPHYLYIGLDFMV